MSKSYFCKSCQAPCFENPPCKQLGHPKLLVMVVARALNRLDDIKLSEREVNAAPNDSIIKAITLAAIRRERKLLNHVLYGTELD